MQRAIRKTHYNPLSATDWIPARVFVKSHFTKSLWGHGSLQTPTAVQYIKHTRTHKIQYIKHVCFAWEPLGRKQSGKRLIRGINKAWYETIPHSASVRLSRPNKTFWSLVKNELGQSDHMPFSQSDVSGLQSGASLKLTGRAYWASTTNISHVSTLECRVGGYCSCVCYQEIDWFVKPNMLYIWHYEKQP